MNNKDIVSSIMANLRELHPELPEKARVIGPAADGVGANE
jgi:hypothetical protein